MTERTSIADNSAASSAPMARPIMSRRRVVSTGPRNSASGITVASDQPEKGNGVSATS